MKFIKLLFFSTLLLFTDCHTKKKAFVSESLRTVSHTYNVISDECPEFRRLVKEGQMMVEKDCDSYYCFVHFDEELWNHFKSQKLNEDKVCVKTLKELEYLFDVKVAATGLSEGVYQAPIAIYTGGTPFGDGQYKYARTIFYLMENDSIVTKP